MAAISRIHSLTLTTLASKFPTLYAHLCSPEIGLNVDPGIYLDTIFEGLFTTILGLDEATRLWDVWVFEGDAVLVRAAVAVFSQVENKLYGAVSRQEVFRLLSGGVDLDGDVVKGTLDREDEWMERVRDAGRSGTGRSKELTASSGVGSGNVTPISGEA